MPMQSGQATANSLRQRGSPSRLSGKNIYNHGAAEDLLAELNRVLAYGREKIIQAEEERPFVIVLCGSFSTGKSSLANALLGCQLPTGHNPITKMVTRIRYGPVRRLSMENLQTGRIQPLPWSELDRYTTLDRRTDKENEILWLELPFSFLH